MSHPIVSFIRGFEFVMYESRLSVPFENTGQRKKLIPWIKLNPHAPPLNRFQLITCKFLFASFMIPHFVALYCCQIFTLNLYDDIVELILKGANT